MQQDKFTFKFYTFFDGTPDQDLLPLDKQLLRDHMKEVILELKELLRGIEEDPSQVDRVKLYYAVSLAQNFGYKTYSNYNWLNLKSQSQKVQLTDILIIDIRYHLVLLLNLFERYDNGINDESVSQKLMETSFDQYIDSQSRYLNERAINLLNDPKIWRSAILWKERKFQVWSLLPGLEFFQILHDYNFPSDCISFNHKVVDLDDITEDVCFHQEKLDFKGF